jgi:hypothetical protein
MYATEMVFRWHEIYTPRFMKIGTDVQAILRYSLGNLRSSNVGITDLWDL